jgi:hypothetical protein
MNPVKPEDTPLRPQKESSSGSNSLPRPELNPLLNPLLAQHLGRWAEVYFTTAPDEREEAIFNLLRELEAKNPGGANSAEMYPADSADDRQPIPRELAPGMQPPEPAPYVASPMKFTEIPVASQHCSSCGHDNPPHHVFCGGCGVRLEGPNAGGRELEIEVPADEGSFRSGVNGKEAARDLAEAELLPASQAPFMEEEEASAVEPTRIEPAVRAGVDTENLCSVPERPSRSYRVFLRATIVAAILALAYMGWNTAKKVRRTSSHSPAVSEQSKAPADPFAQPQPPASDSNQTASPANSATDLSPMSSQAPSPATEKQAEAGKPTERTPDGATAGDAAQTPAGLGNEELATARRLLAGKGGTPRDPAQAALWLWRSVGKQNGEAALLLADLYLKGDGVSKSCDQARVLLDSAALKGVSGAGERLKNLKAFGCP